MSGQNTTGGAGHEYDGVELKDNQTNKETSLPVEIKINETIKVRDYSSKLLGLAYDWVPMDQMKLAVPEEGKAYPAISEEYLTLMQGIPLPLNRIVCEHLSWKKSIGPLAERQKHKRGSWDAGGVQTFGPSEWIKSTLEIDPSAEFVWCINMNQESPEEAAELAEFLGASKENKWGKIRTESGLEKPAKIAIWELGNELDWSAHKITVDEYIAKCKAYIAAIRQVDPDAKFSAHAATAPWSPNQAKNWKDWHRKILGEIGKDIDYLSFHPYYHGYSIDHIEKYLDAISNDVKQSANPDIKLYISEHGKWPPGSGKDWNKYWYQTHALVGCLDTAEWMIRMMSRKDIGAMTYHCHSSGPWGMIYRDKASGKLYTTGIADLFRLLGKVPYNATVVESKVSGKYADVKSGELKFTVASVYDSESGCMYLLLNNRSPETDRKAAFSFEKGEYRIEEITSITAPDMHSFNTADAKNVKLSVQKIEAGELLKEYTVPSKTLLLLKLKKKWSLSGMLF